MDQEKVYPVHRAALAAKNVKYTSSNILPVLQWVTNSGPLGANNCGWYIGHIGLIVQQWYWSTDVLYKTLVSLDFSLWLMGDQQCLWKIDCT